MMNAKLFAVTMILVFLLQPVPGYADDDTFVIPKEVAKENVRSLIKLEEEVSDLRVRNSELQNANWTLVKASKILEDDRSALMDRINEKPKVESSGGNGLLWFVIGVAVSGVATYYTVKGAK